jgi:hypothetical protein
MYMRSGEPSTHSEPWLDATVIVTALGTIMLGILPGSFLALADQAGFFGWLF